jgi:hypothetical protein
MPRRLCAFAFGGGVDDDSNGDPVHAASADAAASATINPHLVLGLRIELHWLTVWILTALILTAWIALLIIASPVAASRFIDLAAEVKTESKRRPTPEPPPFPRLKSLLHRGCAQYGRRRAGDSR